MVTVIEESSKTERYSPSTSKRILGALRRSGAVLMSKNASRIGTIIVVGIVLFVMLGPFFVKYKPMQSTASIDQPPSLAHPFGTDFLGHDLMSQIIFGAYPTLTVAVASGVGATIIGLIVGVLAGYYERLGAALSGITDGMLCFPIIVMILLISSLFVYSNALIATLLILLLWPVSSRALRAQVASLKRRPYVDASKTSGVSDFKLVLTVIIPAVAAIAFAYLIIFTSVSLILATAVQFLGVGNPDVPSWGSIYYWAQQYAFSSGAWWWVIIPGIFITLFISGLALIGFSLEEIFNPRLRTG